MSTVRKLVHKDPVETLTQEWLNLKHAEKELQARRRAVEDELLTHIANPKEGTVHVNQSLKVQFKLTRRVDSDALDEIWDKLPENVQEAFIWKAEVSTKAYKNLGRKMNVVSEVETRPTFVEKGEQS